MNALSVFLIKIANWKSLLSLIMLYIVFPAYLLKNAENKMNSLSGNEVGVIDLTWGYDPPKTLQMIADYSPEARTFYATSEMTIDIVYPIVYAFLFGILLTMLYRQSTWQWVHLLPFITMFFDFMENISIIYLLKTYPLQSQLFAMFCEICKLLKWISFGILILLIVIGLVRLLFRFLNKKTV